MFRSRFRRALAPALLLLAAAHVAAEDIRYPANSGVLNVKAAPYNAVGDGIADDTAALQAALTAGDGKTIYLPNGTYRLTNTISWPGDGGSSISLQGQSQAGTILRLADNTPGFTDAGTPKVLLDGKGNHIPQRFFNSLRNLTVDTGTGNAGVVAVQYYANNMGACRDVTITGQGLIGLEMSHARANGPCLVTRTTIDGFHYGIRTGYAMESVVFEHITLRNQSTLGWLNENAVRTVGASTHLAASQTLSIRRLDASALAVTAFKNPTGHVVLLDSTFAGTGGASSLPAIENGADGQLLLRNITTTGYARALRDGGTDLPATSFTEWLSNPVVSQFAASPSTLNLPIQETPTVPDDDPSTWANIRSFGATDWLLGEGARFDNDAPAVQAAIDSGATTVFVPAGSYRVLSQINVRGNVRRIVGVGGSSSIGAGNNSTGVAYNGIVWAVQPGTHPTVVLENMGTGYAMTSTGVDNQSTRTVVLRDLSIQPPKITGSGDVFIENIVSSYLEFNRQRVWARQLNVERDGTHIINRGGTLWVLGLKTEDFGFILDASAGAKTELLGGMIYSLDDTSGGPMIRNSESLLSFSLAEYLGTYGKPYNTLVQETAGGVTASLPRLTPSTVTVTRPARWSQNNDGTTTSTSGVVGSQFLLYNGASVISTLTIEGNAQNVADNSVSPSLANHTDFGGVQLGGAAVTRTYTVKNSGGSAVTFTGAPRIGLAGTQAAEFSVVADLPGSLAAGAQATFQIRFSPSGTGVRAATVSIPNTQTSDGAHGYAIAGTGIGPAPDIHFAAAGASASLAAGTGGGAPFTVQNTGQGALTATWVLPTAYTFSTSDQLGGPAYNWIEIASGDNLGTEVTSINGRDDSRSGTYDLGFAFPFQGTSFGKLRVHTNGYIELTNTTFTGIESSPYSNNALPAAMAPANTILPYWDDLFFINSNAEASTYSRAYVKTIGTDTAVITFSSVSFWSDLTKRITFQIVLKRSGEIRFNYQFIDNDLSCTVGVQKDGATAVQALHNTSGTRLKSNFSLRFAPPPVVGANTWLSAPTPSPLTVAAAAGATITLPLNANGLVTGESYFTQLRVNSDDPDENPAYLPVTLSVTTAPSYPVITAGQSLTHFVNTALNHPLQASGSPTQWTHVGGVLPPGIVLNTTTGVLGGTPTTLGTYTPSFIATNGSGSSDPASVTMVIEPRPYDFNSGQADFEATFNESAGWGSLWTATSGIGGGGGLPTSSTEYSALLPVSPLTFTTAGQSVALSIAFKARVTAGTTNTAGGDDLRLGINRVNTPLLASGGYLAAGLNEASSNSLTSVMTLESRNNVPGTTTANDANALTLTDGEWYRLETTFTYNGGDSFTAGSRLYGLGADGLSAAVLLDTHNLTRTGLGSLVNVPVYAGFQGRSAAGAGGVRAFDEFYSTPPPATALAIFRTTYGLAADGSQDLLTPAGDGVANLLKYALNMLGTGDGQVEDIDLPNAAVLAPAGSAGLPLVGVGTGADAGKLQLTYIRRKTASNSGIAYAVEFSDALASWAINPSATESLTSIDATFERVTVTDSTVSPSRRFVRVRVTTP